MKIYKVGDKIHKNTSDPGNITELNDLDGGISELIKNGDGSWRWGSGDARPWSTAAPLAWNNYLVVTKVEGESTVRARVLDEAKRITATDRNSSYGEPEDNFQRIADFWNVWLQGTLKDDLALTKGDVAALMILVKMAREMNAPKEDNKVDGAGYFACWAEVDSQ
jgi:hypothetical protein